MNALLIYNTLNFLLGVIVGIGIHAFTLRRVTRTHDITRVGEKLRCIERKVDDAAKSTTITT